MRRLSFQKCEQRARRCGGMACAPPPLQPSTADVTGSARCNPGSQRPGARNRGSSLRASTENVSVRQPLPPCALLGRFLRACIGSFRSAAGARRAPTDATDVSPAHTASVRCPIARATAAPTARASLYSVAPDQQCRHGQGSRKHHRVASCTTSISWRSLPICSATE